MSERTHEIKFYANVHHRCGKYGALVLHTWHVGETSKWMEIEAAKGRKDLAYLDVIDLKKHTTERVYL